MADKIIPKTGPETQAPSTDVESNADTMPVARIVSTKKRTIEVPLEWPVEFDGTLYESVTIRRITAKEVSDYLDALSSIDDVDVAPLPPFIGVPKEVWDGMDDDDRYEVDQKAMDFMPRRLREVAESTPDTTDNTSD